MLILGIDTSCDETCVSVIKPKTQNSKLKISNFEIVSNVISSQVKLHAKYGGVYPFLAKREHQKNLPIVFKKATKKIDISKIDLIGVTIGPGLEPCLWQGINFAKKLAESLKKLIVPVNHIEAHILANFISQNFQFSIFNFQKLLPAICLVVSGGHTQLILMKDVGQYKLIGETRDDAAGECLDKVARLLGLGYPGGPAIAEQARYKFEIRNSKFEIKLPRPMIYQKNYDFSFAGLKTAVLYDFKRRSLGERESKEYIQEISQEVQQAIIDVLIYKTLRAAKNFKVKSIILGGGVAANEELGKQFHFRLLTQKLPLNLFIPERKFCTDNAAMVALTALFHRREGVRDWQKIKAIPQWRIGNKI